MRPALRKIVGFLWRSPVHGQQSIPSFAHDCRPGVSRSRHRPQFKFSQRDDALRAASSSWNGPSIRSRSKRLFQLDAAGSRRPALPPQLLRRHQSPLHGGLPTDRLVAEWWLRSPSVVELPSGAGPAQVALRKSGERIALPANIAEIKKQCPRGSRKNSDGDPREVPEMICPRLTLTANRSPAARSDTTSSSAVRLRLEAR